jgi:hypothetical protein
VSNILNSRDSPEQSADHVHATRVFGNQITLRSIPRSPQGNRDSRVLDLKFVTGWIWTPTTREKYSRVIKWLKHNSIEDAYKIVHAKIPPGELVWLALWVELNSFSNPLFTTRPTPFLSRFLPFLRSPSMQISGRTVATELVTSRPRTEQSAR